MIVLGGSSPPAGLPANVVTTYGLTETGSGVVYDGVPLDGVEVRIEPDGEVHLRGPMLLRAYRDGRPATLAGGWFPTGDVGSWNDGRLVVHGRRGDMIVTGGENVWPEPVERGAGQPSRAWSRWRWPAAPTRSGANVSSPTWCRRQPPRPRRSTTSAST